MGRAFLRLLKKAVPAWQGDSEPTDDSHRELRSLAYKGPTDACRWVATRPTAPAELPLITLSVSPGKMVVMALPFSKNQVRKLGERLRLAEVIADEDAVLLQRLLVAYDDALSEVVTTISEEAGFTVSSRLKNTGTIVEKLRRLRSAHLGNIQDLAGARIVLSGGDTGRQDRVVASLVEKFSQHGWKCKKIDRRVVPVQGYRAVHIVTHVQDLPVEVQVRTSWQHEWAEFMEKVSDRIGRAIRYEGEVDLDSVLDSLSIPRDSPNEVRAGIRELYDTVLTLANKMSHAISAAEIAHGVAGDAAERIIGLVNEQMRDTIAALDSMSINRTV